ncbi:MAG: hypothetical protein Q7T21_03270 [Gallionella sp.]|nr:hypothetical protein [Gallionella sp.]
MKKITKAVFGSDRHLPAGKWLNVCYADISLRRKQLSLFQCGGDLL